MIISVTGKPCSGKGTVGRAFANKFGFEFISTGDMFREACQKLGIESILKFINDKRIIQTDKIIDNNTIKLGKERLNDNILIDSRLAWHFIPKSFKVFLDVDIDTAAKRLLATNRGDEKVSTLAQAKQELEDRWNTENARYQKFYKTDNTNPKNYNLVISTENKSVDEIVEIINKEYKKYLQKQTK